MKLIRCGPCATTGSALRLDPDQSRWWADFGKLLLQVGKPQKGVVALKKAFRLDSDDPAIVARLVEGLCLADRATEARAVLREARFRHPHDSRFRKLWNDFQFQQISDSQFEPAAAPEPVILPFVRRAGLPVAPAAEARWRGASSGWIMFKPAPHLPKPAWLPDTKHAP